MFLIYIYVFVCFSRVLFFSGHHTHTHTSIPILFHSHIIIPGMTETDRGDIPQQLVGVIVPDTYVGFLRLLTFIYTNMLPEGSSDILLDDLLAADRYNIIEMKIYCESMITPTAENWIEIYRVACQINSIRLCNDVKVFLCDNLSVLNAATEMFYKSAHSSDMDLNAIQDDVMQMRRNSYPSPPSQILIDMYSTNLAKAKQEENKIKPNIPIWAIGTALLMTWFSPFFLRIFAFGPLISIANFILLSGLMFMAFKFYALK